VPRKTFVAGEILTALDVNTFLGDQAVMTFTDATERDAELPSPVEGMLIYREDADVYEGWSGSAWVNVASIGAAGYRFVETVYFTSSGTFTKATYPWLRAIRVKVQGAGGGGGGVPASPLNETAAGAGGGGGAYAEKFITDIAGLDASVTVTRGAGGTGGDGTAAATTGGNSSFGALQANGGGAGAQTASTSTLAAALGGLGQTTTSGSPDFVAKGGDAPSGLAIGNSYASSGAGGDSFLGTVSRARVATAGAVEGVAGSEYGGGGAGAMSGTSNNVLRNGGNGADGIVIVELYA